MRKNLLKSMVALAAMVGLGTMNTYADEAGVSLDFEDEDVSMFSIYDANRISVTAVDNEANGSKVANFTCGNANAIALATYDITDITSQAASVKFSFDFNMGEVAGQHRITIGDAKVHTGADGGFVGKNSWGYGSKGAIFYFGTERGKLNGSANENYFKILETASAGSLDELTYKASDVLGVWLHAEIEVDVENKSVSYTISNAAGEMFSDSDLPWASDAATGCTQFDVYFGNTGTTLIDNLVITYVKSSAIFADYKVRYVDAEGNDIKAADVRNAKAGSSIELLAADQNSVYNEDGTKKYIYVSDNSAEVTIAEDGTTEVLVTFREAEVYYAILNCLIEGTTTPLAQLRDDDTQWFFEGDTYKLYPARAYKNADDGFYYTADATSWNGITFTFPGSLSSRTMDGKTFYIGTQYYTKDESLVYYSDIERLALPLEDDGLGQLEGTVNSWYSFSGKYFDRFSGARGIRLDADSYVWTEPIAETDGIYDIVIYGRNDSGSASQSVVLGYRDGEGNVTDLDITVPELQSAVTGSITLQAVEIPANCSLVIKNGGNASLYSLDDVRITATEFVTVSVGEAGVATLVSDKALDFTDAEITAYTAVADMENSVVNLTAIEKVPANTPVVIMGAANASAKLMVPSSTSAVGTNNLKAGEDASVETDGEGVTNYILNAGSQGVGFYKANGKNVAPNHAYLQVAVPAEEASARLRIVIDGEATGIKTIENVQQVIEGYFSLSGQRVSKPTKGLYIVNGKKVLVK